MTKGVAAVRRTVTVPCPPLSNCNRAGGSGVAVVIVTHLEPARLAAGARVPSTTLCRPEA